MSEMFNPAKTFQQAKQGNFDPANPAVNRLSDYDPVEAARKQVLVGDKSETTDPGTVNVAAPTVATTMTKTATTSTAAATPRRAQTQSLAASTLLNG